MLRFKPEVRIREFTGALAVVLTMASQWSLITGIDVEFNSIDDSIGVHVATTLHGWSLAADVDTAGDKFADTKALGEYYRRMLPPGFTVLLEKDHVHVEWNMHRPALAVTGGA